MLSSRVETSSANLCEFARKSIADEKADLIHFTTWTHAEKSAAFSWPSVLITSCGKRLRIGFHIKTVITVK
jgi:hypothetical protein